MKCRLISTMLCFAIGLLTAFAAGAQGPPPSDWINPEPSAVLKAPESPTASEPAPAGPVREQILAWITKNSRYRLDAPVNKQIMKWVDDDVAKGERFSIMLGSKIAKSGKSYQLACWVDRFFVFEFTADEAHALQLDADAVKHTSTGGAPRDQRLPTAAVKIGKVEIDHADNIDGAQPITGQVTLENLGPFPAGSHPALRVGYFMTNTVSTQYSPIREADRAGATIPFKIDAVHTSVGGESNSYAGPLAIFFEVCTEDGAQLATVCSDTVAAVVNVAGNSP